MRRLIHERRTPQEIERLRDPLRVERLEVMRAADLALEGLDHVKTVLDVGTGSGLFAEQFAARGFRVAGLDANPEMLFAARNDVPAGAFQAGTAEQLPFKDGSFDLVFMGLLLHEASDPLSALREARRVAVHRLAVLEWPYEAHGFGPPLNHRLSPEQITLLAQQAGFPSIRSVRLANLVLYVLDQNTSPHRLPGRKLPHIVFLFSDTGGGHRSAAQAIIEALDQKYPGQTTHQMVDFFRDYAPPVLDRAPEFYPALSRQRAYPVMFHQSDEPRRTRAFMRMIWPYIHENVKRLLSECPADLYVSVHPLINGPLAKGLLKWKVNTPFLTIVTDLVTTHAAWYWKELDLIIVPTEVAFERGVQFGIPPERMQVIGLPISMSYSQHDAAGRPAAREKLWWPPGRPLVLLVGGGEGMGPLEEIAQAIDSAGLDLTLVVVAGRNQKLRETLEKRAWQGEVKIYGFTQEMPGFLRAADILVTKAGPGMICEALASGLPMILYSRLDGQEEGNVGYVTSHGTGVWAPQPELVVEAIRRWLENPDERDQAARACLSLARPQAALEIAEAIMKQLGEP